MLAAIMVPRQSLRRKKAIITKNKHLCSQNEQPEMWGIIEKGQLRTGYCQWTADYKPKAAPLRLHRNKLKNTKKLKLLKILYRNFNEWIRSMQPTMMRKRILQNIFTSQH